MIDSESRTYPELTTRAGPRDRPLSVDRSSGGWWEVEWRSGRMTTYDRDPRDHLALGYEPGGAATEVPGGATARQVDLRSPRLHLQLEHSRWRSRSSSLPAGS
jgi:hypothetical protein